MSDPESYLRLNPAAINDELREDYFIVEIAERGNPEILSFPCQLCPGEKKGTVTYLQGRVEMKNNRMRLIVDKMWHYACDTCSFRAYTPEMEAVLRQEIELLKNRTR